MRRSDLIVAGVMVLGSLGYIYHASSIRLPRFSDPLGPRAFPYLIGILGLVSAGWLLVEAYVRAPKSAGKEPGEQVGEPLALPAVTFVVLWSLLFFASFERIDFLLACPVYLFGLTAFFNRGAWVVNAGFSVGVSILLYVAFSELLGVPLPDRVLNFDF